MSEATNEVTVSEREIALRERDMTFRERELAIRERELWTPEESAFQLEMRQAKSLAASPFLPEAIGAYKDGNGNNRTNHEGRIAAAWGVLRYARLLGVDPYVVAQQIYVVHGRVSFSTSFLVGLLNARGNLRKHVDWTTTGTGNDLSVTCSATGQDEIERTVTMTIREANTWGWTGKNSAAWKADPALMLAYRTASKLIRLYFSDAVFGFLSQEEAVDMATEVEIVQATPATKGRAALGSHPRASETRQIVEHLPPVAEERQPDPVPANTTAADEDEP